MLRRTKPLTRKKPLRASRTKRAERHHEPIDDVDQKLWAVLEGRDVAGLKFHHRERIGPVLADFVCPAARLVLLLTGEKAGDDGRAAWLRTNGYRVLEFPIGELSIDAVLDAITQSFQLRIVSGKS